MDNKLTKKMLEKDTIPSTSLRARHMTPASAVPLRQIEASRWAGRTHDTRHRTQDTGRRTQKKDTRHMTQDNCHVPGQKQRREKTLHALQRIVQHKLKQDGCGH
jgi:hypothetical protein